MQRLRQPERESGKGAALPAALWATAEPGPLSGGQALPTRAQARAHTVSGSLYAAASPSWRGKAIWKGPGAWHWRQWRVAAGPPRAKRALAALGKMKFKFCGGGGGLGDGWAKPFLDGPVHSANQGSRLV